MLADHQRKGGVWDVKPPQYGLGRRAGGGSNAQAPPRQHRGLRRAASPVLPRISPHAGGSNVAGGGGSGGGGVLKELHARLAMLEERVSNVDHENAVLRAALERQVADVNKRVAQSNQGMMQEMKRLFALEANTKALERSIGGAGGGSGMEARLQSLEHAVRRDAVTINELRQQLAVERSQGVRHAAPADARLPPGLSDAVAKAAASAASSAQTAAEAHDMLAELRTGLRAKHAEDETNKRLTARKLELLAAELGRVSETVTTVTSTIARRGGMGEGADEGAVPREALQELSRATDARLAQLEARQGAAEKYLTQIGSAQAATAEARGSEAAQLDERLAAMANAHVQLRAVIQEESATRAASEAASLKFMQDLQSLISAKGSEQAEALQSLVKDVSHKLVDERRSTLEQLRDAREAADAAAADRIGAESAAFSTITARFERLEAALAEAQRKASETAVASAKEQQQSVMGLLQQLQAEAAARADDVAAVRRVVEGVSESADRALATATEVQEQDREMLSKLVNAEIELRVQGEAKTIAALERYVQGLSSAVKKVRESGASDVLAVHERLDRLEDTVVKRMSADARNRETQLATVAKSSQEQAQELHAAWQEFESGQRDAWNAFRDELQAAWEEHVGTSSTQVEELVTNTEERVKTLETEIRESVDEEWTARDAQHRRLSQTVERNAAAAADAVTAMQSVATEDRDALAAELAALDARLSSQAREQAKAASDALAEAEETLIKSIQALRETVETGHTANVDDLAQLAASCDARFAVVQDNEVQTARVLQQLQSNMEQATNRLQERTDAQVEDVRREQDELRGAVDKGITDLAMRVSVNAMVTDIAVEGKLEMAIAAAQTDALAQVEGVLQDMDALRDAVNDESEATQESQQQQHRDLQATLAAIERRTAAAHSALDAKYASALGGLDMRLSAATTQLSATSNSVHQHRRSIVGVSSLETRVASGEATVRALEAKLEELRGHVAAQAQATDEEWQVSESLAQAFEKGTPLPNIDDTEKWHVAQPTHSSASAGAGAGAGSGAGDARARISNAAAAGSVVAPATVQYSTDNGGDGSYAEGSAVASSYAYDGGEDHGDAAAYHGEYYGTQGGAAQGDGTVHYHGQHQEQYYDESQAGGVAYETHDVQHTEYTYTAEEGQQQHYDQGQQHYDQGQHHEASTAYASGETAAEDAGAGGGGAGAGAGALEGQGAEAHAAVPRTSSRHSVASVVSVVSNVSRGSRRRRRRRRTGSAGSGSQAAAGVPPRPAASESGSTAIHNAPSRPSTSGQSAAQASVGTQESDMAGLFDDNTRLRQY